MSLCPKPSSEGAPMISYENRTVLFSWYLKPPCSDRVWGKWFLLVLRLGWPPVRWANTWIAKDPGA